MFHKSLDEGMRATTVGCCCAASSGRTWSGHGGSHPEEHHAAQEVFMSQVYVLRKEEGGRHKAFSPATGPQFYIRTMDVTGNIKLPEGVEMVMPATR